MSYTREAIAPANSPSIGSTEPLPERVFNPYAKQVTGTERIIKAQSAMQASGQLDKGGASLAEESSPTADSVKLSPQVAALARKEQRFRQEQQALKTERESLEKEKAEIVELKALKAKLAAKDYSGLDGLVDYNEFSQYEINKQNASDPNQQALKKLEEEVTGIKKAHEQNVSKQFEAAVNERRIAVKSLIASSEEFTSIKELKMEEAVVQHILDTWEHDSQELSVEDAAKEVEELLVEKASRWASIPKLKAKQAPVEEKKQLPPLKSGLKTLTNQVTSGDINKPLKPLHLMSDAERYAEARRRAVERMGLNQRG